MNKLTDEDIKNFQKWSEGNKYLYELLCSCKKNGINTFASCGGHEISEILDTSTEVGLFPYIGINIDSNSLHFIKRIIFELKDISDIRMSAGFAKLADFRSFSITASRTNCCEIFYRISSAINNCTEKGIEYDTTKNKQTESYIKANQLYRSVEKICKSSREEIQRIIKKGEHGYMFDTMTKDLLEYYIRIGDVEWLLMGVEMPYFEKLHNKYKDLQREYYQTIETTNPLLEAPGKENLPSWDLNNWTEEELETAKKSAKEISKLSIELSEDEERT